MRGSTRKRGSTWTAYWDLEPDPLTGKRRQTSKGGFKTRKAAQAHLATVVGQVNAGTCVEPAKLTLTAYLEGWLGVQRSRLRESTHASYCAVLRGRVVPELGSIALDRVSTADVDRVYAKLLREGRADGKGGLSARSVRYTHTVLRRAFRDAVRKRLIRLDPTDAADPPSVSAARAPTMRTWTGEQIGRFLAALVEDRLFAAWRLAASTGMRRGEVLGLRWRDLDLDAGRASVAQTLIEGEGTPRVSKPKGGRGRAVALDAETVCALREHRKAQLAERMLLGPAWTDNELVFCREDGTPIWPRSFSRAFKAHTKTTGLPTIRLHDLRHSWATIALGAGVHPKLVQERLGHAAISITLDVYSHALPTMHEDAAATVASLFTSTAETG
jgi:integrase